MAAQPRTSLITHVSSAGQEQIQIIVHAGANLPVSTINDSVKSYVTWYLFTLLFNLNLKSSKFDFWTVNRDTR